MNNVFDMITSNAAPLFWLVVTVILIVVEMSTAQLICIWFALGAFVSIFAAMLGASGTVQFVVFAVVSAVSLVLTRKFVVSALYVKKTATNADSVIGLAGSVIEEIDNQAQTGRIRLGGLDWAARTVDGTTVHIGETVVAESIEGVKLIVSRKN
ncbi:MAG: NfeD family protein [Angelakisella sp.]